MIKVLNVTFGSIFKTIGRIFAFLCISILFLIIGSKFDIKMPLFGAIRVNASEVEKVYQYVVNGWGSTYNPTTYYSRDANFYSTSMVDNMYSYFSPVFTPSFLGYTPSKIVFTIKFEGQQDFIYNQSAAFDAFVADNLMINLHTSSPNGANSPCSIISSFGNIFTISCPVIENTNSIYGLNFRYSTTYYGNNILFVPTIGLSGVILSYTYDATQQQILTDIANSQHQINDSINDDSVSESNTEYSNFFSGFSSDTFGLTSIITAPLNLIGSVTSSSCSPLGLPLPYINETLTLPCLSTIYSTYFGSFFSIYQTITFGIIAYWVIVRIFNLVKDFKNPDHDEIEVLEL